MCDVEFACLLSLLAWFSSFSFAVCLLHALICLDFFFFDFAFFHCSLVAYVWCCSFGCCDQCSSGHCFGCSLGHWFENSV